MCNNLAQSFVYYFFVNSCKSALICGKLFGIVKIFLYLWGVPVKRYGKRHPEKVAVWGLRAAPVWHV